jgi:hypothetical protein
MDESAISLGKPQMLKSNHLTPPGWSRAKGYNLLFGFLD